MLVVVSGAGQDTNSPGITLSALAELMRNLGCNQAINLDGGASTTMCVRLNQPDSRDKADVPPVMTVCGKTPETKVRSALVLVPANH